MLFMTLNEYIAALRGKRIAVVGVGVSNMPLTELLCKNGLDVTACDRRDIDALGENGRRLLELGVKLRLGPDYLKDLECDVIFRTPGLHPDDPALRAVRSKGAVMTSEMEAFFAVCPCKTIAITGSDGKTTTSSIIAELLRAAGYTVHLGGNIGKPLLTEVPQINKDDVCVLELSSFQLHSMRCSPDVAVVTNISPNHLDVHPNLEDYISAKKNIFLNQKPDSILVLNKDNEITRGFAPEARGQVRFFSRRENVKNGVFLRDGTLYASFGYEVEAILPETEILLPGMHNVENYMAAFAATVELVPADAFRQVARAYKGVPHRLETVRVLNGVTYINDSIASSPSRTIAGLRSFKQKVILIAGGYDKHIPFDVLGPEVVEHVKAMVLTGDTAGKIRAAVEQAPGYEKEKLPIVTVDDFEQAVRTAAGMTQPGDIVTLSPACASFDRFRNFAERGDKFKEIINNI